MDREEELERRRDNYHRLDDSTFNAIVTKAVNEAVSKALEEMENRFFKMLGKVVFNKILSIASIAGLLTYLQVKGFLKLF
jgi:hypothetical protein